MIAPAADFSLVRERVQGASPTFALFLLSKANLALASWHAILSTFTPSRSFPFCRHGAVYCRWRWRWDGLAMAVLFGVQGAGPTANPLVWYNMYFEVYMIVHNWDPVHENGGMWVIFPFTGRGASDVTNTANTTTAVFSTSQHRRCTPAHDPDTPKVLPIGWYHFFSCRC